MDVKNTAISVADPFVRHLIAQYLKRRDEELSVLNSLLAEDDFEAIVLIAHKLYGSGSAYGLDEISRLGAKLERAAGVRESSEVAGLIAELERYLRQLKLAG